MSTTKSIIIPSNTWTNLYSTSGITLGKSVDIYNKGATNAIVAESVAAPVSTNVGTTVYTGSILSSVHVTPNSIGLWAYCQDNTGLLIIQD